MVAGIIVAAVGDELAIAHPRGHAGPGDGGDRPRWPGALSAGHLLFKRAVFGVWSTPRVVAIAALGVIAVVGGAWAPLALATAAVLVVAAVAWQDARAEHHATLPAPVDERVEEASGAS